MMSSHREFIAPATKFKSKMPENVPIYSFTLPFFNTPVINTLNIIFIAWQ